MRGKAASSGTISRVFRITPAYAGKSVLAKKTLNRCIGSPPPMRGKALCDTRIGKRRGITPAYAGKSESYDKLF